ncbi:MAG: MYXO-CTERM sorting domain-containing protein [Byssovorax sp.]
MPNSIASKLALLVPIALGLAGWASPAAAGVSEPNGLSIPQPISADAPFQTSANSLTLPALFAARNEQIDWQQDATTSPAVFSPLCGFTGTLVLRGGGCKVDFGWYNVNPGNVPPLDSEIYVLVPKSDPIFNQTFHPQAGEAGQTFTAAAIQTDPNYKGGLIGFAFKGNPSEVCTQTHYSQPELNVTCTSCSPPAPWITALIYKSTATPNAFYVAFEDLPMSPTSFAGFPGQMYTNDGDFNDFVYFITGIDCQGAGQPCDTGLLGVCAPGLTGCAVGMMTVCQPQAKPTGEVCDGLDNDCNGSVDDGVGLCGMDEVCDHGKCVGSCGSAEFPCALGLVCNKDGHCVETACQDVPCPADKVCHEGVCSGPCDNVTCPKGQACRPGLAKCVDPCEGVVCSSGSVCEGGACVLACTCKACGAGSVCVTGSGHCVDSGCESKTCAPGQVCSGGACVDACQGAMCPGGAVCANGQCGTPQTTTSTTGAGGMGQGGTSFVGAGGGSTSNGVGSGGMTGAGGAVKSPPQDAGCGCVVAGGGASNHAREAAWGMALLALALRSARRRRRV